jgi:hypothetical protein
VFTGLCIVIKAHSWVKSCFNELKTKLDGFFLFRVYRNNLVSFAGLHV